MYRIDFNLYRNYLYRNDFVSKRPATFLFIAYTWHSVKRVLSGHPLLSDHLPHSSLDFYFSLSLLPSFFPFLASFFFSCWVFSRLHFGGKVFRTAALKHGIRNPESGNGSGITETETEYGICERKIQAIDLKKRILDNDNEINKQIKKDTNE